MSFTVTLYSSINYKLYLHITETKHNKHLYLIQFSINYKLYLHITETQSGNV